MKSFEPSKATPEEVRQFALYISKGFATNVANWRMRYIRQPTDRDDEILRQLIDEVDAACAQLRTHLKPGKSQ